MAKCLAKEQARAEGRATYVSPTPCKRGHTGTRRVASGSCTECAKAARVRAYYLNDGRARGRKDAQKRREKDPLAERQRAVKVTLKSKYGLTEQDYAGMYAAQNGCCAVCGHGVISRLDISRRMYSGPGAPDRTTARVDHCHSTGTIRGLLCSDCNLMLGHAKDNEEVLLNAVRYLRASRATAHAISRAQHVTLQGEIEPRKRDLDSSARRGSRRDELSPFYSEV